MSIKQNITVIDKQYSNHPPTSAQIESLYKLWQEQNPDSEILPGTTQNIFAVVTGNGNGGGKHLVTFYLYITLVHS